MIVSTSKPIMRVVPKGHTFNADPLPISTIGTLASMHLMVICKGLIWVAPYGGSSSSEKVREG